MRSGLRSVHIHRHRENTESGKPTRVCSPPAAIPQVVWCGVARELVIGGPLFNLQNFGWKS
jgi:hypothetical protein